MRYYKYYHRPWGRADLRGETMKANTVTVNGMVYDSRTGKPLRQERGAHSVAKNAGAVHSRTQSSQTLNRRYVKKQTTPTAPKHTVQTSHKTRVAPGKDATHIEVRKFAPVRPAKPASAAHKSMDIAPTRHPLAEKAYAAQAAKASHTPKHSNGHAPHKSAPAPLAIKPSTVLKNEAIAEATKAMPARSTKKAIKPAKKSSTRSHRFSLAMAALGFMIFSGYLTYLYMPNVTTRVAAAQAGINAHYPAYQPSGYSLAGPVAYQPGEVSMKFAANAGPQNYTLTQRRSAWDSSAVLQNYVKPKSNQQYSTTEANGLTIYNYDTTYAWVNGGILYTIDGNAPLSSEQVQRIATSL